MQPDLTGMKFQPPLLLTGEAIQHYVERSRVRYQGVPPA